MRGSTHCSPSSSTSAIWARAKSQRPNGLGEADTQVGFIAEDVLDNPVTSQFSQIKDNGDGTLKLLVEVEVIAGCCRD